MSDPLKLICLIGAFILLAAVLVLLSNHGVLGGRLRYGGRLESLRLG